MLNAGLAIQSSRAMNPYNEYHSWWAAKYSDKNCGSRFLFRYSTSYLFSRMLRVVTFSPAARTEMQDDQGLEGLDGGGCKGRS